MKDDIYLKVDNLSYLINGQEILKDISFSLKRGEILVIIGPNGSGKSTLLKSIMGLISPSSGKVTIKGESVKKSLGNIAYVPQNFDFDRKIPITVYEFMALENCGNRGHSNKHIKSALSEVGMEGSENKKLGVLSGGEFQRVMIARALLHEKELLIFDEPASGIDNQGEAEIYKLIASLHKKKGTTFLIVSHELSVVSQYASSVLCLNKSLMCFGPPQTAISPEVLKKLYGADVSVYHHNH